MKINRKFLLGTIAASIGIALFFAMIPSVAAATTTSPHLSLEFRSVSDTGDCLDFGLGAPCTNCVWTGGPLTNQNGAKLGAVCTDVLTAVGAKQTWHAYYLSFSSSSGSIASRNLGETSGTLYPGQSLTFIFGLSPTCPSQYVPTIVKIVGSYNTVAIAYSGCG